MAWIKPNGAMKKLLSDLSGAEGRLQKAMEWAVRRSAERVRDDLARKLPREVIEAVQDLKVVEVTGAPEGQFAFAVVGESAKEVESYPPWESKFKGAAYLAISYEMGVNGKPKRATFVPAVSSAVRSVHEDLQAAQDNLEWTRAEETGSISSGEVSTLNDFQDALGIRTKG